MKSSFDNQDQNPAPSGEPAEAASRSAGRAADPDTPRTVIRGESLQDDVIPRPDSDPFAAITDYLNCTFPIPERTEYIRDFLGRFHEVVGPDFDPVEERGRGLYGWRRSFTLGESGALMGIGGQRGKAFLSLSGAACARIPNYVWPTFIELIGDTLGGRITRWDGAVDDYEGIHGVDWAVSQYQGDGFHTAGNKPKCKQSGNWLEPDGSGRTFYVGARRNGKMMRIYDKGKQLGDPDSPWTRWELELHNTDREIPWDVLLRPGQYVAGAYRCTDWISKESCRIRTHKRKQQIAEEVLTANAKRSYGKYINYLLNKYQDPVHVLNLLRREGIPARLSDPEPTD